MFQLITDTASDLTFDYLNEHNVDFVGFTVTINNQEYHTELPDSIDYQWFIESLKSGVMPTTSQVNVGQFVELFQKYAQKEVPVLYLAFSSGLSGTYQSALTAREVVLEEYPTADIRILDTFMAAGGEGLIVHQAIHLRDAGLSLDAIEEQLTEIIPRVHAWFTVDDLNHLLHGGRISKFQAVVGSIASIKPILNVSADGHLQNVGKVRGRNKSLKTIAQEIIDGIENPASATVFICHSGDLEAAKLVKQHIESEISVKEFIINPLGATIAAHTGAGCVAVFAIGKTKR